MFPNKNTLFIFGSVREPKKWVKIDFINREHTPDVNLAGSEVQNVTVKNFLKIFLDKSGGVVYFLLSV